jgi:arginase
VAGVTVVEVPQWRGSGAATAERLVEGARLLGDLVGADRCVRVEVDDDLVVTASRVREALAGVGDGFVVTVGGDCGVELEPVVAARRTYGDRLVVVWFDAHGDLNTPDSSPSGAYHGMVLRALTGEGPAGLVADPAVDPRRVVLAGGRDLDPGEVAFVASSGIGHVTTADPQALITAVVEAGGASQGSDNAGGGQPSSGGAGVAGARSAGVAGAGSADVAEVGSVGAVGVGAAGVGASPSRQGEGGGMAGPQADDAVVYVHVDLDVLEPEVFGSVGSPVPGGLLPEELVRMVTALGERFEVVGLGITEYEPGGTDDSHVLAPVVKALVEVCQPGRTAPR